MEKTAFDGTRRNLLKDFDSLYVVNLHGDIRKDSMRDGVPLGEKNTIFGQAAMVGISVSFFVRNSRARKGLNYADVEFRSTREEKFAVLDEWRSWKGVPWRKLHPDRKANWITEGMRNEYEDFVGLEQIFTKHSRGIATCRDAWACNFKDVDLRSNVNETIEFYNSEVDRFRRTTPPPNNLDDFVIYDDHRISWSRDLKADLQRVRYAEFSADKVRRYLYRPFMLSFAFVDRVINEEVYSMPSTFPNEASEAENVGISVLVYGRKAFGALATGSISDLNLYSDPQQCFPFYTYDEDGTNRRENITDWALEQFRAHYGDRSITKWDIFHYVYAVLHHPEYRERYAANLKRELPRVPFVSSSTNTSQASHPERSAALARSEGSMHSSAEYTDPSARKKRGSQDDITVFKAFVDAGERLAELHVKYEEQPDATEGRGTAPSPHKLAWLENAQGKPDYRVQKMKIGKDKTSLFYNDYWTLTDIPAEVYEYRLGNRSALDWIVDQYQVSTDKRSGITNDPNREDDPEYIKRLIGQVIYVSMETVKIVKALPEFVVETSAAAGA